MKGIPEQIKTNIEEQKENCPFCKIASGEIPAKIVYEDEKMIAFLDINPAVKGHVIVMPKEHYPIMPYMEYEDFQELFGLTGQIISAIKKGAISEGANLFIANGYAAGQMSNHFLTHIIPRNQNDGLEMLNALGNASHDQKTVDIIKNNLMVMAESYFKDHPATWHKPREIKTHPVRKFTKKQVLKIIESNPQLKDAIIKAPNALKQQIQTNEQLKQLFEGIDIDEIITHFRKGTTEEPPHPPPIQETQVEPSQTQQSESQPATKTPDENTQEKTKKPEPNDDNREHEKPTEQQPEKGNKPANANLDDISRLFE